VSVGAPLLEAGDLVSVPLGRDAGSGDLKHGGGKGPVAGGKPTAVEGTGLILDDGLLVCRKGCEERVGRQN
jgi:hypothetical protein